MKCEECLLNLENYIEDELDHPSVQRLESHLAYCAACSNEFEKLADEELMYARYRQDIDVNPSLWQAVRVEIEKARPQNNATWRQRFLRSWTQFPLFGFSRLKNIRVAFIATSLVFAISLLGFEFVNQTIKLPIGENPSQSLQAFEQNNSSSPNINGAAENTNPIPLTAFKSDSGIRRHDSHHSMLTHFVEADHQTTDQTIIQQNNLSKAMPVGDYAQAFVEHPLLPSADARALIAQNPNSQDRSLVLINGPSPNPNNIARRESVGASGNTELSSAHVSAGVNKQYVGVPAAVEPFSLPATKSETKHRLARFETGLQFSSFSFQDISDFSRRRLTPGVGARFTYNLNDFMALEAEGNIYPTALKNDRSLKNLISTQGLFGARLGKRWKNIGIFAKLRPGLMTFSGATKDARARSAKNDMRLPSDADAHFKSIVRPVTDIGGVIEIYTAPRVVTRIDVGDTIVFNAQRISSPSYSGDISQPATSPSFAKHNLQISTGVGFRF